MEKNCLQDFFLNSIRKKKISVIVFLANGVKLQGIVTWFDNFSLLLKKDKISQLIYKHAVSTIMPNESMLSPENEDFLVKLEDKIEKELPEGQA